MDISLKLPLAAPEKFRDLFSSSERSPWRSDSRVHRLTRESAASFPKLIRALRQSLPPWKRGRLDDWCSGVLAWTPWPGAVVASERAARLLAPVTKRAGVDAWRAEVTPDSARGPEDVHLLLTGLALRGHELDDELFWDAWQFALSEFQQSQSLLDPPEGTDCPADKQLALGCELRWLAAVVHRDFVEAGEWVRAARRALSRWLHEYLDDDGVPVGEALSRLPAALRCLCRCRRLAAARGETLLRRKDRKPLRKLLEHAAALIDHQGRMAGSDTAVPWRELAALVDEATSRSHAELRGLYRGLSKRTGEEGRLDGGKFPAGPASLPAFQSDPSALAGLRRGWSPASDACLVEHHGAAVNLWLNVRGIPLFAGEWGLSLHVAETPTAPSAAWECSCWFSDRDGDFLELEQKWSDGTRHERQIYLSRKEHFAVLTECFRPGDSAPPIVLESRCPLASGWRGKRDPSTREWRLTGGRRDRVRILPFSLEQEITHKADGECRIDEHSFTLRQTGRGAIYAGLLIDWHPDRRRDSADWRKLTVTENRTTVPASDAVGFRFRVGKSQWLLYHSLRATAAPRAVLGMHTLFETVLARFDRDGDAVALINVEAPNGDESRKEKE